PVDTPDQRINEIFRVRHEAQYIEALGINPGDVIDRPIRIGYPADISLHVAIAEGDAAIPFEASNCLRIRLVIALAMRDRDFDYLAAAIVRGEWRIVSFYSQMLHPADEAQIGVAHQDAGQKPGFDQDL